MSLTMSSNAHKLRHDQMVSLVIVDQNGIPYATARTQSGDVDVYIPHREAYELCFTNHSHQHSAVAEVIIDGKEVGKWMLKANEYLCVKRPASRDARFTLVREDSVSEYAGNLSAAGELTVIVRRVKEDRRCPVNVTDGRRSGQPLFGLEDNIETDGDAVVPDCGVTLLGEASGQRFRSVATPETVFLTMIRRRLIAV